jgi:hypothetical protein
MSIGTMVSLAVQRRREKTELGDEAAAGDADQQMTQLEKVSAFIPSDVVTVYVAGLGILTPSEAIARWVWFAIGLVLVPVFVAIGIALEKRKSGIWPGWTAGFLLVIFGLLSFTAWAASLPNTPFLLVVSNATQIAALAVIVLASIMYPVAEYFDIVPKAARYAAPQTEKHLRPEADQPPPATSSSPTSSP